MGGFAGVEPGDLLALGGELVQRGGDLVVGHVRLQGRPVPVAGDQPGGHGIGDEPGAGPGRPGRGGGLAAGAAVGGVAPGAGQPGDDRGAAAADDQGEPGGQLPDHVRGGHVVAGGVVLAADLPRRLPAQRGRRLQRAHVGDAGQEHLHRGGVEDDLAAVLAPPVGELGLAVHDRDDLDALAAGVRQPGRQRDRADLRNLVQVILSFGVARAVTCGVPSWTVLDGHQWVIRVFWWPDCYRPGLVVRWSPRARASWRRSRRLVGEGRLRCKAAVSRARWDAPVGRWPAGTGTPGCGGAVA